MKKRSLIEFITIFILSMIFSLIFNTLTTDDIWTYGFAYNIASGIKIYRDFNIVVTPLSPLLNALVLLIFGKNIINIYLLNAIYSTCIYFFMKKNNPHSYYIPYAIFLLILHPNYNILVLLLFYIITTLEKEHSSDYLIGIILGLIFLTKQNILLFLLIPTIITGTISSKIKRFIGFIIPISCTFIYLVYNHSLNDFINYCFLGLSEFGTKNMFINLVSLFIIIPSIIYLLVKYHKTKDKTILYLISLYGISYPIMDAYHFLLSFLPTFNYFLKGLNLNKKVVAITFTIFLIILSIFNISTIFYSSNYTYPNKTLNFKYNKIDNKTVDEINNLTAYYKKNSGITFFVNSSGYIVKLESFTPINKYDLMLNGNNGKNGNNQITKEISTICSENKCYFWLNKYLYESNDFSQYNKELHTYVMNNYKPTETIYGLTIYTN